ncbi:hypothetical protein PG991_009257 [Apiospora marii]|uniref:Uncharacterized protein n=1 Tax=Apiospora marii TaxID=335849 RepID=A0ABR1RK67_9PEZI
MADTVRITVVAVCEGPHETATINSVHLGRSFKFEASYHPSPSLFKLSFTLADNVTLSLRFVPDVISSLKKIACRDTDDNLHFETIRHALDSHRTFTRLQFNLYPHRRAQFVVPTSFDPNYCDDEARRVLASLASLAAAPTFSLYMHDRDIPKAQYQAIYRTYQSWPSATSTQIEALERLMDLRTLYKGKGGTLLDAEVVDGLLGYDCPPEYPGPDDHLLPPSQQSTASKAASSDVATVAVSTPPGYRDNDLGHACTDMPADIQVFSAYMRPERSKRTWSSGSEKEKAQSWRRSAKRRATGPLPQHEDGTVRDLRDQVEQLQEENDELRSRVQDLEDRLAAKMQDLQELVDEKVALAEANHAELRQDHEQLERQVASYEDGAIGDWIEPIVQKHIHDRAEEIVVSIRNDVRRQLRRAFDD